MDDRELIDEQIEYYRRTAPEYYEITTPPGDILNAYGEHAYGRSDGAYTSEPRARSSGRRDHT